MKPTVTIDLEEYKTLKEIEFDKICFCCKTLKPLSYYHNLATSPDGKSPSCKECVCKRINEANVKNGRKLDEEYVLNRMLLTQIKKKESNKIYYKIYGNRWRKKNRQKYLEGMKRYQNKHEVYFIKLIYQQFSYLNRKQL